MEKQLIYPRDWRDDARPASGNESSNSYRNSHFYGSSRHSFPLSRCEENISARIYIYIFARDLLSRSGSSSTSSRNDFISKKRNVREQELKLRVGEKKGWNERRRRNKVKRGEKSEKEWKWKERKGEDEAGKLDVKRRKRRSVAGYASPGSQIFSLSRERSRVSRRGPPAATEIIYAKTSTCMEKGGRRGRETEGHTWRE